MSTLKPAIGLFGINMNYLAQPQRAKVVAQEAESLGFESLWTGEHVVLPDPREARWYAESLGSLLTASVLMQNAPPAIAEAYIATRLSGARGRTAGTIGAVDETAILSRLGGLTC